MDEIVTLEVFGEGRADVGKSFTDASTPDRGVVVIFTHRLCGSPERMRVKSKHFAHLQGKNLKQKVRFAKRQANYNVGTDAAVFVLDTEGDLGQRDELIKGRDSELPDFSMAIGVAHPCIEAWLLCDAAAISQAMGLSPAHVDLPHQPEALPAPQKERKKTHGSKTDPKSLLARICNVARNELSAKEKDSIAKSNSDLALMRSRCLQSFEPFALEIEERIRPLFE